MAIHDKIRLTGLLRKKPRRAGLFYVSVDCPRRVRLTTMLPTCANICSYGATILHADVDSFFASVEQRDDPAAARTAGDRRRRGRAGGELRGEGVRRPHRDGRPRRRGGSARTPWSSRRGCAPTRRRAGRCSRSSRTRRRSSRGSRSTRRSSTCAGCSGSRARRREIAARLRREVRERVGLPITVGVARTKFLAKVASGVAKPDGLLVVPPDGELEFLHPLPVERLWGVGPKTAARLHERGIRTVGEVAQLPAGRARRNARSRDRPPPPRPRAEPRPPPGPNRAATRLDRLAAGARLEAASTRGDRRDPRRARRSRHRPHASRRPRRADGRAPPSLRRLLTRDPLAHAAPGDRRDRRDPPRRTRAARRRGAADRGARADVDRVGRRRTSSTPAPCSSCCRSSAAGGAALDEAVDEIRERYGTAAIMRAVLLGRRLGPRDAAPAGLMTSAPVVQHELGRRGGRLVGRPVHGDTVAERPVVHVRRADRPPRAVGG